MQEDEWSGQSKGDREVTYPLPGPSERGVRGRKQQPPLEGSLPSHFRALPFKAFKSKYLRK